MLLIILIRSSYAGLSQNLPNDTMCKPVSELKVIYTAALKYRYTDSLLKIAEAQLAELKYNLSLLTDKEQEEKNNYERQITNLNEQINAYKDWMKVDARALKREKRKSFWSKVGGVVTSAILAYLYITK